MSYNLTSLTEGIWNDVETFDTLEGAKEFIREALEDEDDGEKWALIPEDGNEPEYHADTLKDLLARLG